MSNGVMPETQPANAATREPVLRITTGSKIYGGVHAIEGVDFDLYAGEIHGLIGQNAAGDGDRSERLLGRDVGARDHDLIDFGG